NEDVAHAVLHAAFSDDPLDFAIKLDELAALERLDDKFLDVHHFRSFYALASANAAASRSNREPLGRSVWRRKRDRLWHVARCCHWTRMTVRCIPGIASRRSSSRVAASGVCTRASSAKEKAGGSAETCTVPRCTPLTLVAFVRIRSLTRLSSTAPSIAPKTMGCPLAAAWVTI